MKKCPYCAEKIPTNTVKCEFCWERVSPEKRTNTKAAKDSKLNLLASQIKDHLEFIWYECETALGEKMDTLICRSHSKSNLVIGCNNDANIAFVKARYTLNKEKNVNLDKEYYEIFNTINSETSITKRYHGITKDKDVIINIEWVLHGYEKKPFGTFIDLFEDEVATHLDYFKNYNT